MASVEEILSVGLDVGTTTTSMVVSRLSVKNVAAGFVAPRVEVVRREILYRSPVRFTPLVDGALIDLEALEGTLREDYARAGVSPEEVRTGAVIITGEAARKENARRVAKVIASMAGTFVVATAGPHLEAYLAGLGSGASRASRERGLRIWNVDVGGGTTNSALFDRGKLRSTWCADVGGRVIRFEVGRARVVGFSRAGEVLASRLGIALREGLALSLPQLEEMARALARSVLSVLEGEPDELASALAIGELPHRFVEADGLFLSGGVGRLFYEGEFGRDEGELLRYGDLGPMLARALKELEVKMPFPVLRPEETIYATVIGAGVHSAELSGSTIYFSRSEVLPLVDLPVIRLENPYDGEAVRGELLSKLRTFSSLEGHLLPALAVPRARGVGFDELKGLAEAIAFAYREVGLKGPVVVVCEDDLGKALGMVLKGILGGGWDVVVVDEVSLEEGDYVDVGEPLYGGTVIPVVMKTLVFSA